MAGCHEAQRQRHRPGRLGLHCRQFRVESVNEGVGPPEGFGSWADRVAVPQPDAGIDRTAPAQSIAPLDQHSFFGMAVGELREVRQGGGGQDKGGSLLRIGMGKAPDSGYQRL